jgi:hypothetical protein
VGQCGPVLRRRPGGLLGRLEWPGLAWALAMPARWTWVGLGFGYAGTIKPRLWVELNLGCQKIEFWFRNYFAAYLN